MLTNQIYPSIVQIIKKKLNIADNPKNKTKLNYNNNDKYNRNLFPRKRSIGHNFFKD